VTTIDTFEGLQDDVYDKLGQFCDDLNAAIDRIVDMLDDASDVVSTAISVLNPFDGLNPFDSAVKRAIEKWNNEILPAIEQMWDELQTNVWDAVGDLAGRPLDLLDYSHAFNRVKANIYTEGDMAQKLTLLSGSWSGFAFRNYQTVATGQDAALRDFSLAMDAGATLTADAANKILTLWEQLSTQFLGWTADLLGCFEKATEVDAIVTFEIPAMFDLAQGVWQAIIDIADILAQFLITQATTGANSWQQLALGARGLPQNHWPMVEEGNSDVINDPGEWAPQTA
jgi:uncharacterized protein YukE